jgi:hypothetical protein
MYTQPIPKFYIISMYPNVIDSGPPCQFAHNTIKTFTIQFSDPYLTTSTK